MDDLRDLMSENARLLGETILATREFQVVQRQYLDERREQMKTVMRLFELQADQNIRQAEQNRQQAEQNAAVEGQIESLVRAIEAFIRGQRRNGE